MTRQDRDVPLSLLQTEPGGSCKAPNTVSSLASTHALSSCPRKLFVLHLVLVKHGFHPVLNTLTRYLPRAAIIVVWCAAV